jgi:hypothetical protein
MPSNSAARLRQIPFPDDVADPSDQLRLREASLGIREPEIGEHFAATRLDRGWCRVIGLIFQAHDRPILASSGTGVEKGHQQDAADAGRLRYDAASPALGIPGPIEMA